jgi:UDP-N-acetylglucosamine 4,6-dehydratase
MKIMITGVTGSLGRAVTDFFLNETDSHVFGYSRDEKKQSEIPPHGRLTLILGDVRNQSRLLEATRGMDLLFHFAALKRVDTLELNPEESIETNVNGTMHVLHAQRMNKIKRVVLSSTDKACKPINVYGFCKALSEKLVLRNKNNVVVRYGNVMASRGSVVPQFVESIKKRGEINLTAKEMTRFFITIASAAKFVIDSAFEKDGGLKIYPEMKACKILDLANTIHEMQGGIPGELRINTIGVRPGEKLHEDLRHEYEGEPASSLSSPPYSKEELRRMLWPLVEAVE